jgi:hypothetical protein
MDTTKTPERRLVRPAALLAALSALGLTFSLMVGPALADHTDGPLVDGVTVEGNQTCGSLGDWDNEFKVDEGEPEGTYDQDDPNVEVSGDTDFTVTIDSENDTMSFSANHEVDAVFVKGGSHGTLYDYTSIGGTDHDNGLVTPDGEAISHVSFCFTDEPEESEEPSVESIPPSVESVPPSVESVPPSVESVPPSVESVPPSVASVPPSVEESTEASVEESVPGSVEGSVLGNTGTPEPSTPDTAFGSENGPSPLPTIVFGAILLASLAALAWVNVQAVRTRS